MRTTKIISAALSTLSACVLALAPVHAAASGDSQSEIPRARGTATGLWSQDAQGHGVARADLTHNGDVQVSLLMLANLTPGESPFAGSLQGKLVDAAQPDPHKAPGVLSMFGSWNRIDGKGGKFEAMLYLNGPALIPVIPVGTIGGEYRLDEQELSASYSIQG